MNKQHTLTISLNYNTINNIQYEINAYTINQDCQSIALKLDSSGKIDINDINIDYRQTNKRPS